ncbi:DNA alkylation repair protein [Streptacidiphilus pinicola]|uniref:DNA alkylation repair protein n=1 Tax=Streptacidiphilus pinicola TaxID=2219663 RepID=A0A2X0IRF7_9ACTN|nr:DNA alkylation repair protein [Streptacidiphilus pinicola]RAG87197.1 DNA alkylation repair protein [Streptacidiphilus pinicola]
MPFADQLISVECVEALAEVFTGVAPRRGWTGTRAVAASLPGMALSERARAVRDALLDDLPAGWSASEKIITRALDDPAFTGWMIWPVTEAVASLATADGSEAAFDAGLALLARLTPRLTGEFALRTFLNTDLDRTLAMAQTWTRHDDAQVRRLASEGTRPRLPWAKRVPALLARPAATQGVLDALHADPSDYVRRSVANHLNDLSRSDPALAVTTARRWTGTATPGTADAVAGVVRHGLRTLIKQAHPDALALLGYGAADHLSVDGPHLHSERVTIGETLTFDATITNTAAAPVKIAVDYVVHYRKANSQLVPRVYKLTTRNLAPGGKLALTRGQKFVPLSTRRLHPGGHALELQVNGTRYGYTAFHLQEP